MDTAPRDVPSPSGLDFLLPFAGLAALAALAGFGAALGSFVFFSSAMGMFVSRVFTPRSPSTLVFGDRGRAAAP
jgi:hypothetical protein